MTHPTTPYQWLNRLKAISQSKAVWIWGSGNQGRGIAQSLSTYGIEYGGFIDASTDQQRVTIFGKRVLSPETFLKTGDPHRFVIIASYFYEKEIEAACLKTGLAKNNDFISYKFLKPHDYVVEVSGRCNLHCISCPRANGSGDHKQAGFMSLHTFQKVIDKMIAESPFVGNIQMYQWGEPLLNPDLPEMIAHANARGIKCAISSNLNLKADYQSLIRAKPEWLRISCSGSGANYEQTHTGGSWKLFKHHLETISQWRTVYYPSMKVELFYHVYQHNRGKDYGTIKQLCQAHGIEFHPVNAYLIGLDDVLKHMEGAPLPEKTKRAESMLCVRLEDGMHLARKQIAKACPSLRCVLINPDLRVSNCMMYYNRKDNTAANNYLETPLAEIEKKRRHCDLCRRCRSQAMHRYCHVYWNTPVIKGAA